MSPFTQVAVHTHRVYGVSRPDDDPILDDLFRRQIGFWIVYFTGWLPDGFVDRNARRCVVDDFGNLVAV